MHNISPKQIDQSCNADCAYTHVSSGQKSKSNGNLQDNPQGVQIDTERLLQASNRVKNLNNQGANHQGSNNQTKLQQLESILANVSQVQVKQQQSNQAVSTESKSQCRHPSNHEKSAFTLAPHTPRSTILLMNSIKTVIERLTQNSSDTSEDIRQQRKALLKLIADTLGIPDKENLWSHRSHQWVDNPAFLMTFDSIVKDRKNAEALGIKDTFFFNTAKTGADALKDSHIKEDFKLLLNKLDGIPVLGIEQGAPNKSKNTAEYGDLKTFLTNYTVPEEKFLRNASTLIGALSFNSSQKEYTCLITMNSSKKRLGYQSQTNQSGTKITQSHPYYPKSKSYTAYLNFLSSEKAESQLQDGKLVYKAGADAIIFDPPAGTEVTKEDFLDWILDSSSKRADEPKKAPCLIHICAADLINFGMLETVEEKQPTRIVPRTGTSVIRPNNEHSIASSDKENCAPGSSNLENVPKDINHRVYDTEHMMLTLAHELSKHIASKDGTDNTMDISLLSSYKACISCTRAMTTLPFNENFKNLSRFFYVDTGAHDYRIEH